MNVAADGKAIIHPKAVSWIKGIAILSAARDDALVKGLARTGDGIGIVQLLRRKGQK